jgi:membrane protease YdiL (CAAX protease family)
VSQPSALSPAPERSTERRATAFELALVLGLPTAVFLPASIRVLAHHAGRVAFTDSELESTLIVEAAVAGLLLPYLRRRGWRPGAAAGAPEPWDALRGSLLWLGCMTAYSLAFFVLYIVAPHMAAELQARPLSGSVSVPVAVAASVLNPLFEEFLWLGYAIPALGSRLGLRAACVVSILLRVAVHVYQGPMAIVGILPIGACLTWYYARTRRLWPVVVAHVIVDAIGLSVLTGSVR